VYQYDIIKGGFKMNKIQENILEIAKVPGNMVRITGVGVVSLRSLNEGIFFTTPNNDRTFISTDELIDPRTKHVTGTISVYDKVTQRMSPLKHVEWQVKWLY
jgi:hypothetical protein